MSNDTALAAALARIASLEAALTAKATAKVSCKVSEKGAMSIYGLGRFPFTFYRSQWEAFSAALPQINAFFEANKAMLTVKD